LAQALNLLYLTNPKNGEVRGQQRFAAQDVHGPFAGYHSVFLSEVSLDETLNIQMLQKFARECFQLIQVGAGYNTIFVDRCPINLHKNSSHAKTGWNTISIGLEFCDMMRIQQLTFEKLQSSFRKHSKRQKMTYNFLGLF